MMPHNPPLWFLYCMICLEWLYYGISHLSKQWYKWGVVVLLSVFGCVMAVLGHKWIWNLSLAMIVLPLYMIAAEYRTSIITWAKNASTALLSDLLVLSVAGIGAGYIFNGHVALADNCIGNPGLYYVTIVSVVGLLLSVSLLIEKTHIRLRLLLLIGQNTLLILCTHMPTFGIIKGIALICHVSLDFFKSTAGCLCLWIGSFVILLPAAYVLNRFCPVLVGKKRISL